jgi:site-specific recombinase XerD
MERALRVRVGGPLAGSAPELIEFLSEQGYSDQSTAEHVGRLAWLSGWLEAEGLGPAAVDEALVGHVVDALHRVGKGRKCTPCSFRVVLGFLRRRGIVPMPPVVTPTPADGLLGDYRRYLVVERSLAPLTLPGYLGTAAWFLAEACGGDPARVPALSAGDVVSFVLRVAESRRPASVNTVVVGVRSLLRWFYVTGMIDTPLAQATPWLARGATSTLPRPLEAGHAAAMLATCERDTLAGARAFAVLSVLVRLGLRAGEVVAIEVGDVDWRRGEVMIRGKGGWRERLPLPVDVGDALVAYLALRGARSDFRQLFLHVRAPLGPMTMSNVRFVVRQACERAGIPDTGTHRLRHGAAADMLRNGAPLHEIGQILRHRDIQTTAIYAKVDFAALATLARPWPGSGR